MIKEETKVENKEAELHEELPKKEKKKLEKANEEIDKLKAEVNHWKNEYYRAYADTKNLRNNLEQDYRNALKYRSEGFIEELLPILDSFHMALANEPTDPTLKNYLTGFQYVYRNMVAVLENEGVSELVPEVGKKFDPNTMDAVDTVEGDQDNVVLKVYGCGYKLHDRIVRPAKVQVAVLKKQESEKTEEKASFDA
jgi:molecular chaperone GrpE